MRPGTRSGGVSAPTAVRPLAARWLGVSLAATWLVAGCGNGKSPTESGRLGEERQGELRETPKITHVVDGLFLGNGKLIPRDGGTECPYQGYWSGYPRGTNVRVRISDRVPGPARSAIESALDPLADATGGALTATTTVVADPNPEPGVNEVTVTEVAQPRLVGCSSNDGCVQYRFAGRGLLMGARIVSAPGVGLSALVHNVVGHGVLGLCHLDADQIGGAGASLMSGGFGAPPGSGPSSLTSLDLNAIRSVYASSVNPGAGRSAFLAARLVDLQAGQLPRVP